MRTGRAFVGFLVAAAGFIGVSCVAGSDGEPSQTREELGAELCTHIRESECGTPELEEECLAELEQNLADAAAEGCEAELDEYLRCAAGSAIECVTFDTTPESTRPTLANSTCVDLVLEFHECVTWVAPLCGIGMGTDPSGSALCSVSCPDFSSECSGSSANGAVSCVCDEGPNQGNTFEATDCGRDLTYKTGHLCGYEPIDDDGESGY
jgi:hypothetical protein